MARVEDDKPDSSGTVRIRQIRRVLWTVLVLNVAVAVAKMIGGYISGSVAMQADGFHSLFDGISNVVGLVGIGLAARPADRDHPYGHAKYETYASLAIGAMLALVAYNVGSSAVRELMVGAQPPDINSVSFAIMLGTLTINLFVTTYERRIGKRIGSEILIADAAHTFSDVWVSLGVIAGLIAVRLGYPQADPLIAIVVAFTIAFGAWQVFRQATVTLSDTARIPPADVCAAARSVEGVLGCHHVRTRGTEAEIYVDLHVQVDPRLSVQDGHRISTEVEDTVCSVFETAVDVVVHVEPYDEYQATRTAEEIEAGLA